MAYAKENDKLLFKQFFLAQPSHCLAQEDKRQKHNHMLTMGRLFHSLTCSSLTPSIAGRIRESDLPVGNFVAWVFIQMCTHETGYRTDFLSFWKIYRRI